MTEQGHFRGVSFRNPAASSPQHLLGWWPLGDVANDWPVGYPYFEDKSFYQRPLSLAISEGVVSGGITSGSAYSGTEYASVMDTDGGSLQLGNNLSLDWFGAPQHGANFLVSPNSIDTRILDEFILGVAYKPPFSGELYPQRTDGHCNTDPSVIFAGDRFTGGYFPSVMFQARSARGILSNVTYDGSILLNNGFYIWAQPSVQGDPVFRHGCDPTDSSQDWLAYSWRSGSSNPWTIKGGCFLNGGNYQAFSVSVDGDLDVWTVCAIKAKRGQTLKFLIGSLDMDPITLAPFAAPSFVEYDSGVQTSAVIPDSGTKNFFHIGNVGVQGSGFDPSERYAWGYFDEAFLFDKAMTAADLEVEIANTHDWLTGGTMSDSGDASTSSERDVPTPLDSRVLDPTVVPQVETHVDPPTSTPGGYPPEPRRLYGSGKGRFASLSYGSPYVAGSRLTVPSGVWTNTSWSPPLTGSDTAPAGTFGGDSIFTIPSGSGPEDAFNPSYHYTDWEAIYTLQAQGWFHDTVPFSRLGQRGIRIIDVDTGLVLRTSGFPVTVGYRDGIASHVTNTDWVKLGIAGLASDDGWAWTFVSTEQVDVHMTPGQRLRVQVWQDSGHDLVFGYALSGWNNAGMSISYTYSWPAWTSAH
jgi:hypothetical protein